VPDSLGLGSKRTYNRFLLLVAGLGGLLSSFNVGIIGGALPYLEATSKLTGSQLSIIVAAVRLGSVFSKLLPGCLRWISRKPLMVIRGAVFLLSILVIALSPSYGALFLGRLLQGVSGGFVGVVVPLYLAECVPAKDRGKGTGIMPVAANARHHVCCGDRDLLQLSRSSTSWLWRRFCRKQRARRWKRLKHILKCGERTHVCSCDGRWEWKL
jgi:hypothetical protein